MSYVLGVDLGTSSLKGLVVDREGQVVASASKDYPLLHPQTGYSEQDPQEWLDAFVDVVQQLTTKVADFTKELEGISFSGQMHSLVVLDENEQVLRPAILWNDVRTTKQCQEIMTTFGETLLSITKNRALEGFTLPKILWIQENEPAVWQQVRHMMLPKDYLGFWLSGTMHMDYSDAAGTLLLDEEKKEWSDSILDRFAIPKAYLPELIDSTGMIGTLRQELTAQFGFEKEVQLFAGGADNACAAAGAGILDDKTAMASIGTSGVFLSLENSAEQDYQGKLHLFNHVVKDRFYSMGVTLAAGHSLNWFKETFAPQQSFDELLAEIPTIPAGANGLLFSPYIVGERTPHVDSKIRGSFIGMDTTHTLSHFARAVLEGITFSLKDSQVLMEQVAGKSFKKVVSVGGGAKNAAWLQIQADIFDADILCLEAEQGPGLGAAMLAAVGLGWYASLPECAETFVSYLPAVHPNKEAVEQYQKLYAIYREIYPATKEICHQLNEY